MRKKMIFILLLCILPLYGSIHFTKLQIEKPASYNLDLAEKVNIINRFLKKNKIEYMSVDSIIENSFVSPDDALNRYLFMKNIELMEKYQNF